MALGVLRYRRAIGHRGTTRARVPNRRNTRIRPAPHSVLLYSASKPRHLSREAQRADGTRAPKQENNDPGVKHIPGDPIDERRPIR